MKSEWMKAIVGAMLYYFIWVVTPYIIIAISNHSPARYAYGTIVGWWCALYVSYVFNVKLRALAPLFILFLCGLLVTTTSRINILLYHDPPTASDLFSDPLFILLMFTAPASPLFINVITKQVVKRLKIKFPDAFVDL